MNNATGPGLGRLHFQVAAGSHSLGLLRDPTCVFAPCHGGPMVYCQAFIEASPPAPVRNGFESHGTGWRWLFGRVSGSWSRLVGPGPCLGLGAFLWPGRKRWGRGPVLATGPKSRLNGLVGAAARLSGESVHRGLVSSGPWVPFPSKPSCACPVLPGLADTKRRRLGPRPGHGGGRCSFAFGARQVSPPARGQGPP